MAHCWKKMDTRERTKRVESLLQTGMSREEVALNFGISKATLYHFVKNHMQDFSKELNAKERTKKKKVTEDAFEEKQAERIQVPWIEAVRGGFPPLLAARLFRLEYPGDLTLEIIQELRGMGVCDYFIAEGFSAPVSLVRVLEKDKGRYGGRFENG